MSSPFRILTVCIGNICRSPFAERFLRNQLPAEQFEITSAGVRGLTGREMDPEARLQLEAYGGDAAGFAARRITPQLAAAADLVLAATKDVRSLILEESPAVLRRTFTFKELAALLEVAPDTSPRALVEWAGKHRSRAAGVEQDIADPYRQGTEAHQLAAAEIVAALRPLISAWNPQ